tara:strand:- start:245 stop:571 length:327 start_codon:yes stop_codon:yes gene_type:complete
MINNTKNGATKEEVRQHLQNSGERNIVGGSGGLGFVGGAGVKAAKGAFQIIKNLLTRGSKPKNIGGFREFANPKLRDHFNKVPKSKPVDFKGPNPAHNTGAGGNSYPR